MERAIGLERDKHLDSRACHSHIIKLSEFHCLITTTHQAADSYPVALNLGDNIFFLCRSGLVGNPTLSLPSQGLEYNGCDSDQDVLSLCNDHDRRVCRMD